ncbi:putative Anti-sigma factor antagonist [Candidatus Zixiibacteriota bacterium]|nr:putative Anti-sigma factor antagonist [candidate division Zixibacteria bacterium]
MDNIKISVSESGRDDSISIIRVDGVIDTLTATHLEEVLDRILKRERFKIVLDLAGVDYISSAGWGIFISRIREVRENRGDIKLANMVPNVHEIYELLEFDNVLTAFENLNSAKEAFSGAQTDGVKKKDPTVAVRTIVEELPALTGSPIALGAGNQVSPAVEAERTEAEGIVLRAIREDPFYTIAELRLVLEETAPDLRVGWWGIFQILKRNRLVSRRARFRFARQAWKRS